MGRDVESSISLLRSCFGYRRSVELSDHSLHYLVRIPLDYFAGFSVIYAHEIGHGCWAEPFRRIKVSAYILNRLTNHFIVPKSSKPPAQCRRTAIKMLGGHVHVVIILSLVPLP